ncbi:hypothetical protein Mycsm_06576 (plasmid) [Mycobacterium sp. JS623]|nr:hypothetical protein Mycsm_06576 [Mycobacterium sp. JS623]
MNRVIVAGFAADLGAAAVQQCTSADRVVDVCARDVLQIGVLSVCRGLTPTVNQGPRFDGRSGNQRFSTRRIGQGDASTVDRLAAVHRDNAPVLVFVDIGGSFNNDTACVDCAPGNVDDHLTHDVVPFMHARFGVSRRSSN